MSTWKPISFALLLGGLAGLLAAPASAAPEGGDISEEIKAQMDKIIELMRQNEKALLELSTGKRARPARVDVDPTLPEQPGGRGGEGESSSRPSESGARTVEEIEELVRKSQKTGQAIPHELEELVRMVPL